MFYFTSVVSTLVVSTCVVSKDVESTTVESATTSSFSPTTANTANTGAAYYRTRNIYDITLLPTQYSGNNLTDNANTGGLVEGRPWTT